MYHVSLASQSMAAEKFPKFLPTLDHILAEKIFHFLYEFRFQCKTQTFTFSKGKKGLDFKLKLILSFAKIWVQSYLSHFVERYFTVNSQIFQAKEIP